MREWKEALEYGVTVASGVGTVFALSEILTRRFFNIPNTAIQQANTNAQAADVQPAL